MIALAYVLITIYVVALSYITLYCLAQLHLLFYYKRHQRTNQHKPQITPTIVGELPFVTVQLPIFNELYVVDRLIDTIVEFDYPKDRYEIHVLDDSTDETVALIAKKVAQYKALGFQIEHIHRVNRQGYKAGALKDATPKAKGDLIAIFDADFLPKKDFLLKTVSYFQNPEIGVVQTRWEHINKKYSLLTRLQAMQLNVHFTVEQRGRLAGNCFLQFNGTAGVWRKETIEDAGGWEADTLTEDLDLSYRAQLKGWKIIFLEKIGSPAELPAEMNGLKSQQFRWMKGGAETAKKMIPVIWKSDLAFHQKVHAFAHLMSSGVFIFVFLAAISSVPLVFLMGELSVNLNYFAVFLISLVAMIAVYYVANVEAALKKENYFKMLFKFVVIFPVFLALSMGLSLHNTIAVLQGYWGKKSPFVRTPKFNIKNISDSFKSHKYLTGKINWTTIFEGLLSVYFMFGVYAGFAYGDPSFVIFHGLLALGFGGIFFYSVRHVKS